MRAIENKKGFTLVEVMLAATLGIIIMSAVMMLVSGMARTTNRFMRQNITAGEISLLRTAFLNEVREKPHQTYDNVTDYVSFTDTNGTSSFQFDNSNSSIIYTRDDGTTIDLLTNSVVSSFTVNSMPGTKGVIMQVDIKENELNDEVNTYSIFATTR